MKPKPFCELKNLTVPTAIRVAPITHIGVISAARPSRRQMSEFSVILESPNGGGSKIRRNLEQVATDRLIRPLLQQASGCRVTGPPSRAGGPPSIAATLSLHAFVEIRPAFAAGQLLVRRFLAAIGPFR